jgi:hypothetical protein
MQFTLFSAKYSKGGTHVATLGGKNFHADFRFAWKGNLALSYSHLSSPTKAGKNPTKFWKL